MRKLLLGLVIEVFVGVAFAGLILALAIPLMHRAAEAAADDVLARVVIVGVLALSIAIALFRPGSAIRRYTNR
jgi:ABC-type Mn2+/Zn2+ transport system permease subunit